MLYFYFPNEIIFSKNIIDDTNYNEKISKNILNMKTVSFNNN